MMKLSEISRESLFQENKALLSELETAYTNMQAVLEQTAKEKEIAYAELEQKFQALEKIYSELSKKENMLIHLEKLSAVGQFITEIIHEISSPLTSIMGNAELIKFNNPPDGIRSRVDQILLEIDRMNVYLKRFRDMSYRGLEDFRKFDINENLTECLATVEIIKPRKVSLRQALSDEPLFVLGDPFQTNQIFLNLAKNAFEAISGDEGEIFFESRLVSRGFIEDPDQFSPYYCQTVENWRKMLITHNEFVLVEISDNGEGVADSELQTLFEPYYSSKSSEDGMGLGLSISADIAKRHNGNIAVKSVPGTGTCFQVALPLSSPYF